MSGIDRGGFLRTGGSCAAHLALMGAGLSWTARAAWAAAPRFRVVGAEP